MYEFIILLSIAAVLSFIPVIRTPLTIIETFFHELSHGIAAIITFGKIKKIELETNGAGLCYTIGGWRHIVLLAGYLGASAFGFLIYYIGYNIQSHQAEPFLFGMLVMFIFVILMWVRNIKTLLCMIMIITIFYFPLKHELYEYTSMYLKFIGIYVCLSAVRAPLDLIDGQDIGDGAELYKITFLPEGIWIALWVAFGGYCLYNIYLLSVFQENLAKFM
jgi:hypothetical protein